MPSRRLGQSLGINNVPPKSCSYSCVYCQVGPTAAPEIEPRTFFGPAEVVTAVSDSVREHRARGERIDYLTFVPDGEPTLDLHLGELIEGLRPLGIPVAVISNGSLVWREEVRAALRRADWVSLKVDTVDAAVWRRLNRPHHSLDLAAVQDGMLQLGAEFEGELVTETMLVPELNDGREELEATAEFLQRLSPAAAYLAVPTRPPAEPWVRPPPEEVVTAAFQRLSARLPRVELLTGLEGESFGTTGEPSRDLLAITAVHPMREESVLAFLQRAGADRSVLDQLVESGELRAVDYEGRRFFLRRLSSSPRRGGEPPRPATTS